MPNLNIEEKIQEALKKKSFKENKLDYLGLALIFCLMLYITFIIGYFIPALSVFIFLLVDIPFIMGFKHFIWFGPASGETLIEGFKVSMVCGYLNFISYIKIFFTTNLKAILWSIVAFILSISVGGALLDVIFNSDINAIIQSVGENATYKNFAEAVFNNANLKNGIIAIEIVAFVASIVTFYILKLNRALLPYISFLRLSNLEGKSMDGVIAHTKKVVSTRRWNYYLKSTLYHLLYIIPVGLTIIVYLLLSKNPVYSHVTIDLICSLVFFVSMFPAILFIELNYRDFCIDANQEYVKEHKKMLNDAINDLDKNDKH